ncbi:YdgH/BhsA/McbA-like domain containing protein [Acerihabitans sp. TG2]|uniref:multiple stress resistance protein BhsA n=1 Tax=Acerihabitans sp. TG2 TaxID=3096008 RepID=UPI002B227DA8|nr:YdgH/BhsA/McbA-like domain containing protein [Acerihabitans sp. TG2]MEA9391496.1 YdgH/BhsA/McbA-like domain containing protein [Acerihabitans sp. TG2]
MKNVKYTVAALALSLVSFGSFAADLVTSAPANQRVVGVISATGGSNLSSLESQLAAKATESGAKSFQITSATGQNKLHGTAVIFE